MNKMTNDNIIKSLGPKSWAFFALYSIYPKERRAAKKFLFFDKKKFFSNIYALYFILQVVYAERTYEY